MATETGKPVKTSAAARAQRAREAAEQARQAARSKQRPSRVLKRQEAAEPDYGTGKLSIARMLRAFHYDR